MEGIQKYRHRTSRVARHPVDSSRSQRIRNPRDACQVRLLTVAFMRKLTSIILSIVTVAEVSHCSFFAAHSLNQTMSQVLALVSFRPNHLTLSASILDQLAALPASELPPVNNADLVPETGKPLLSLSRILCYSVRTFIQASTTSQTEPCFSKNRS